MTGRLFILMMGSFLIAACDKSTDQDLSKSADEVAVTVNAAVSTDTIVRPKFRLDAKGTFSAESIDSYPDSHESVYQYIDENLDDHIAEIQRWIRQPSVSAQNDGIQEMAELLRDDLTALGFQEAELVELLG